MNDVTGTDSGPDSTNPSRVPDILIVAANALGPIGGALSSALSIHVSNKRFKNIEATLAALEQQLANLPPESFEATLRSDDFVHLCMNALERAQHEHRERRRRAIGTMLANLAADAPFHFDTSNHFMQLLTEVSDAGLVLLQQLADRGIKVKGDEDWATFDDLSQFLGDTKREIVAATLQQLGSAGMVKTTGKSTLMRNTNPVGLWYSCNYSITETGLDFVGYLAS
jgi:hypothetical protein